jgi:hypothetical protein
MHAQMKTVLTRLEALDEQPGTGTLAEISEDAQTT